MADFANTTRHELRCVLVLAYESEGIDDELERQHLDLDIPLFLPSGNVSDDDDLESMAKSMLRIYRRSFPDLTFLGWEIQWR